MLFGDPERKRRKEREKNLERDRDFNRKKSNEAKQNFPKRQLVQPKPFQLKILWPNKTSRKRKGKRRKHKTYNPYALI
jgi:hypothetical protein